MRLAPPRPALRRRALAGPPPRRATSRGSQAVLAPRGVRALPPAAEPRPPPHASASPAACRRSSPAPTTPTTPRWLAAALLHDVGKLDADLGVYGRVVATVPAPPPAPACADAWSERSGFTRRVGLYLRHPELGGDRIRAGRRPDEAARWAGAHHDSGRACDRLGIPRASSPPSTRPTTTDAESAARSRWTQRAESTASRASARRDAHRRSTGVAIASASRPRRAMRVDLGRVGLELRVALLHRPEELDDRVGDAP